MAPKLYLFQASPPARAVIFTAEALGISLEFQELDFFKGDLLTPEYLKINPLHTVPTLDDDGFTIFDSHAINTYLVGKYGKDDSLYPKDLRKRALIDQRLHFDSGVLFPLLRTVDWAYVKKEIKEVPSRMIWQFKDAYDFMEIFLDRHQWAAGDNVTLADFSLFTTITCLDYHVKIDPQTYPKITAWIKRVQALPCCVSHQDGLKAFADLFDSIKA